MTWGSLEATVYELAQQIYLSYSNKYFTWKISRQTVKTIKENPWKGGKM